MRLNQHTLGSAWVMCPRCHDMAQPTEVTGPFPADESFIFGAYYRLELSCGNVMRIAEDPLIQMKAGQKNKERAQRAYLN